MGKQLWGWLFSSSLFGYKFAWKWQLLAHILAVMSLGIYGTHSAFPLAKGLSAEPGWLQALHLSMHGVLYPAKTPFANAKDQVNVWSGIPLWNYVPILVILGLEWHKYKAINYTVMQHLSISLEPEDFWPGSRTCRWKLQYSFHCTKPLKENGG